MSGSANLGADGVPTPQVVAAWARLAVLPAEQVPLWASYWMVAGYEGDALVSLAGLHGDNRYDVLDALPGALADCGVEMSLSDRAAAAVAFTDLACQYLEGRTEPLTVVEQVTKILSETGYQESVLDLPLVTVWTLDDEWGQGWGRSVEQLTAVVRSACEEQLSNGAAAT